MKHIYTFDYRDTFEAIEVKRISLRAIILRGNFILLIHLKKTNEFKLPGGGLEQHENYEEALRREVLEESGATIQSIDSCIGYIDQIWPDKYVLNEVFQMRNIYYKCQIEDGFIEQNLDKYESELGFTPVWVDLNEAIKTNKKRLAIGSDYHWTERTTFILKYIQNGG